MHVVQKKFCHTHNAFMECSLVAIHTEETVHLLRHFCASWSQTLQWVEMHVNQVQAPLSPASCANFLFAGYWLCCRSSAACAACSMQPLSPNFVTNYLNFCSNGWAYKWSGYIEGRRILQVTLSSNKMHSKPPTLVANRNNSLSMLLDKNRTNDILQDLKIISVVR